MMLKHYLNLWQQAKAIIIIIFSLEIDAKSSSQMAIAQNIHNPGLLSPFLRRKESLIKLVTTTTIKAEALRENTTHSHLAFLEINLYSQDSYKTEG